jgi:chemotaxis protein MotB
MAELRQDPPVRVVRKNGSHGAHHGGAWKVAYADFVTAMMALFIVLWIIGQSKQIKEYVANYFKDPGAFFENTKGEGAANNGRIEAAPKAPEEFLKREQERLQKMGNAILYSVEKQPELNSLAQQLKMEIVKEGLRIELLERSESFFFDVGTASLKPDAVQILTLIGAEVGKLPNHLILEGHTDSRAYSSQVGYSNFELSADRANSARRVLVTSGVREDQVDEVRGYADTKLRNANDPYDVTNRRISIIIKYEEK